MIKKHLPLVFILSAICMLHSCGTSRPKATQIKEVKSNIVYKRDNIDSLATVKSGLSESFIKNYTEEINYRTTANHTSTPEPIELIANFSLDTSATLKKDTLIRLVDISDSNNSVTIYQNKKTNELTAKIRSKQPTRDIPFSELQIKRTYNEQSNKVDTTSKATHVIKAKVDSIDKTAVITKDIKTEKSDRLEVWIVAGILFTIVGIIAFLKFKPKSKT